jgi:hypothetical protein
MSSEWNAVRGHLRDANPVNERDFADAWQDREAQTLLALIRKEASVPTSTRDPELTVGSSGFAKRPSTRALAPTVLAVAVLLIVLATVVVFHKRGSVPDVAAAPSATASAPTIGTAPAVVSPISQPSAAVCGYRHDEDGFRLDVATASAIRASDPKIDGAGALRLARAEHGGEQLPTSPASVFVTPVLLTQTQTGVQWPGYAATLVGRLMYDVNVSGMHELVSGKVGGTPVFADSAEILIDAVTGKEAITLACGSPTTPAAPTPPTEAQSPLVVSTFGGLTLRHPNAWTAVENEITFYGPGSPLGYLTSDPAGGQCVAGRDMQTNRQITCPPSHTSLRVEGVLVTVERVGLSLGPAIEANTTVAGQPAELSSGQVATEPHACPEGAVYVSTVRLSLTTSPGAHEIDVTGCFGPQADADAQHAFADMLRTATYQPG